MNSASETSQDPSMSEFLRRATYYSLFVMIFLMPFWVAFGRAFFGASGWGVFFTLPIAALAVFPFHILIAVLAFVGNKTKLSIRSLSLILGYYLLMIASQLSFVDGGDTPESVGSALTFGGVPETLNTIIFAISFWGGIIAMIGVVVSLIKDIADRKRQASRRRS